MKHFFVSFFPNALACFWGRNLLWQGLAIVGTMFLVITGFDWWYFTSVYTTSLRAVLFPAILVGAFIPLFLPLILLVWGMVLRGKKTSMVGFALLQATLLGSLLSSLYKAFTGRIQPDVTNTLVDTSHDFQFGFLKHGIFWGWPSSHTTIAFAMAVALCVLFPEKKRLRFFVLLYALYIGVGVSVRIHWFSEFFAGAIIGSVIGIVVGKSFAPFFKSA
jgi:membrane-associated phospholipid phosphatase